MANARIDLLGMGEIPLIAGLYNQVFHPARDEAFFHRRFRGRHNNLLMVAAIENDAVGFLLGFELKPTIFFTWLVGVLPTVRRSGVGSQLMDASNAWALQQGYERARLECHNGHRSMLHLCLEHRYDILGIRWDPDRGENLVIFEKALEE